MQERVRWEPVTDVGYHLGWIPKLFLVYLLTVVLMSLVKSVGVMRQLWSFTRDSIESDRRVNQPLHILRQCGNKIQSMRRLAVFTLLLSVLVATEFLGSNLNLIVEQKSFGPAALGGIVIEVLAVFGFGILVCTVLYGSSALLEGVLQRRRTSWELSSEEAKDSPR